MPISISRHGKLWNITWSWEIPKKISKELKAVAENDKKEDSKQAMMFGRVAKITLANTSNELVEMDFSDYGDFATFLQIQDTFHVSRLSFYGGHEERRAIGGNGSAKGHVKLVSVVWGAVNYRCG